MGADMRSENPDHAEEPETAMRVLERDDGTLSGEPGMLRAGSGERAHRRLVVSAGPAPGPVSIGRRLASVRAG